MSAAMTTSAIVPSPAAYVPVPFAPSTTIIMEFRLEIFVVIPVPAVKVLPVVIIPIIVDLFERMTFDLVRDRIIFDYHPRTVIVGGRIPGISMVQIIGVTQVEHVVADARRYVETQTGW